MAGESASEPLPGTACTAKGLAGRGRLLGQQESHETYRPLRAQPHRAVSTSATSALAVLDLPPGPQGRGHVHPAPRRHRSRTLDGSFCRGHPHRPPPGSASSGTARSGRSASHGAVRRSCRSAQGGRAALRLLRERRRASTEAQAASSRAVSRRSMIAPASNWTTTRPSSKPRDAARTGASASPTQARAPASSRFRPSSPGTTSFAATRPWTWRCSPTRFSSAPTAASLYTFTSVVDDIDFGITHIVRGEDYVTNTGVQIGIFEALGATSPALAHHSLLIGADGHALPRSGSAHCRSRPSAPMGSSPWPF